MGKGMSMLSRRLQRFNIENRAHKVISKEKPTPAPHHKPSARQSEIMHKADSDFLKKHNMKDAKLDHHLKNVYLVSHTAEMMEKLRVKNPDRPLPQSRTVRDDLEFGVFEPTEVTIGRCTLRQAIKFITDHNTEPTKHTAAEIAAEYKLSLESTSNILKYFRTFKLYIPEKELKETPLQPSLHEKMKDQNNPKHLT
ncbi:protein NDUFAF4 homolog isoform X1 [Neodiprion virginianus]|uniref:protein NDUFAF4 homolog isoform X1 n=1 Tax=Neodiprion virginianus TaxID=2961670 RepID=UPI001EE7412D|nr:protein NDUFAF4 homolog isoform X1 [Neodiprion virginianus]